MNAAYNEARRGGGLEAGLRNNELTNNLDKNTEFVNELMERVARLVADKCAPIELGGFSFPSGLKPADVLAEMEDAALGILAAEIRGYPEIAQALPEKFRQGVLSGYAENLSGLERAAIILTQEETPATGHYEDRFAMKVYSILFALQEGGEL